MIWRRALHLRSRRIVILRFTLDGRRGHGDRGAIRTTRWRHGGSAVFVGHGAIGWQAVGVAEHQAGVGDDVDDAEEGPGEEEMGQEVFGEEGVDAVVAEDVEAEVEVDIAGQVENGEAYACGDEEHDPGDHTLK